MGCDISFRNYKKASPSEASAIYETQEEILRPRINVRSPSRTGSHDNLCRNQASVSEGDFSSLEFKDWTPGLESVISLCSGPQEIYSDVSDSIVCSITDTSLGDGFAEEATAPNSSQYDAYREKHNSITMSGTNSFAEDLTSTGCYSQGSSTDENTLSHVIIEGVFPEWDLASLTEASGDFFYQSSFLSNSILELNTDSNISEFSQQEGVLCELTENFRPVSLLVNTLSFDKFSVNNNAILCWDEDSFTSSTDVQDEGNSETTKRISDFSCLPGRSVSISALDIDVYKKCTSPSHVEVEQTSCFKDRRPGPESPKSFLVDLQVQSTQPNEDIPTTEKRIPPVAREVGTPNVLVRNIFVSQEKRTKTKIGEEP